MKTNICNFNDKLLDPKCGEATINKLKEILELRDRKDIELHVEEIE